MAETTSAAQVIQNLLKLRHTEVKTNEEAQRLRQEIMDAEDQVHLVLSRYGPLVFNGKVWYTYLPPRVSRIGSVEVSNAELLPWPPLKFEPPAELLPKSEQAPEKIAGFIPPREMDK